MDKSDAFFIKNKKVFINIPVKNKGKFRWKNRKNANSYGEGFSTEKVSYSEESYIEWQIGYDVPIKEYNNDPKAKSTVLNKLTFTNLKGVDKHPYELSEFLFAMFKAGLINKKDIDNLRKEVSQSKTSLEETFKIKTDLVGDYKADGIKFSQQNITLPTFVYCEQNNISYVEISIQKQQHATGVQPMLYFTIPITSLTNYKDMIGKTSKDLKFDHTTFVIDDNNKACLMNMFKFFGICSKSHKHDVDEILRLIGEYTKKFNNKR